MDKPIITSFEALAPLLVQKYERYLPTAFDDSMTLLEKVNKVIIYLNQIGQLTNDVVDQWNAVMEWVLADGIGEAVTARLDQMTEDGTLEQIINEAIFEDLNNDIDSLQLDIVKKADKLALAVNAKDYGYVGDGVADDTLAIQNAINAGIEIKIPRGTPKVTASLIVPTNRIIRGEGKWGTVIQATGDFTLFNLTSIDAKTGVKIEDIGMINTDIATGTKGVAFDLNYFTNGSSIKNVRIEAFRIGIQMKKTWYASFTDIFIRQCGTGLQLYSPSSIEQVNAIKFDSLHIQRCDNAVITIGTNVSVGIKFESCTFEQCNKTAVKINRFSPVTLDNCYFEGNYQDAKGNVTLSWTTPIDVDIDVSGSRNLVALNNCYFARSNDYIPSSEKTSIYMKGTTKLKVDNCIFTCNTSSYIDSDIYSDSSEIPIINHVARDGVSKTVYTGKANYEVVASKADVNLRFSNTSALYFMVPKLRKYWVKFIPSATVSPSTAPILQFYDMIAGSSLGSVDMGTTFSNNTPIDKAVVSVDAGTYLRVQVSTGSDIDVAGTLIVYAVNPS